MLARDSTSGCYSDTSKSQGSLGAWGSFDARQLLASCQQRFLDMRLIVQDHESAGLVTTKLSDKTPVIGPAYLYVDHQTSDAVTS